MPGCLKFALQIIIQNTSISHARRQTFNRAPNFVKVPRLCTIQNASNSQAKIHLRTPFLQNSFHWLLSNFIYFLKKGKNRNSFLYLICAWYAWNLVIVSKSLKSFSFIILQKNYFNLSSVFFKFCSIKYRSSRQRCSIKKGNTCARVSFLRTSFTEHLWTTASQTRKPLRLLFTLCLHFLLNFCRCHDNKRVNQAWKQIQ